MKVMDFNNIPSTKPYLLRAIHEWCSDNGFTPYMAVSVDHSVEVPMGFVTDGQIVLNISYGATQGLQMANDMVSFKGRFNGQVQDIFVPVNRVLAIYARENGQGMAFPATEAGPTPESKDSRVAPDQQSASKPSDAKGPALVSVVSATSDKSGDSNTSQTDSTPRPPNGGAGGLRRVK